jgi:hypothetical protein
MTAHLFRSPNPDSAEELLLFQGDAAEDSRLIYVSPDGSIMAALAPDAVVVMREQQLDLEAYILQHVAPDFERLAQVGESSD